MRIEKVVIQNINSLAGKFEIDFSANGYDEGLFAIVGPSGAGKSTVLDAMCLALYGKTPRISTVSETQNEIMTKNETMCGAEVVFWSRRKKYKATFSHKRAKGKNPFGQVKREIIAYTPDGTGNIIASMIKEVNQKIIGITGLDYSQFTRSIMLAQFQFAEFLKADSNARADILEQISDMDIYRNISATVYERTAKEKQTLMGIQAKMQIVTVLSDDDQKALEKELSALDSAIRTHRDLADQFAGCSSAITSINDQQNNLSQYEKDARPLQERLEAHQKDFAQAKQAEKKLKADQTELQKTLKAVRDLDYKLGTAQTELNRLQTEISGDDTKIKQNKLKILGLFKKYMPDADNQKLKSLYAQTDAADSIRTEAKADLQTAKDKENHIRKQIDTLLQGEDEKRWQQRLDLLEAAYPIAQANSAIREAEVRRLALEDTHKKLIREQEKQQQQEKQIEEKLLLIRLQQKFASEREKLEDGKPCPLCGAIDHPGASTNDDAHFAKQVSAQKQQLLGSMKKTQQQIANAAGSIAAEEKQIKEKTRVATTGKQKLSAMEITLEDAGVDLIDDSATEKIERSVNEAKLIVREHTALIKALGTASQTVAKYTQQLGDVDKDALAITHLKQTIQDIEKQKTARSKASVKTQNMFGDLSKQRKALFGDKSADREEKGMATSVEKAAQAVETCRTQAQTAQRKSAQNTADIARTKKQIETQNEILIQKYAAAKKSAADVLAALPLGDNETKALYAILKGHAASLTDLPQHSGGVIKVIAKGLHELSSKQTERKGSVSRQLSDNEKNKASLGALRKDEKKQTAVCDKWNRLNKLIGSADGIKFSRMAQGITFEVLLQYANSNLSKMSDRYILVRDERNPSKPLEISVVDNYQAGDIRPVSNLSGGESFVVSMALALGLSEMSSGKTQIDSLFIDEGFASLDEEYLEAALRTLSMLGNRENKLVGVISHVGALKERIDTQIQVTKLTGGRSTLAGPGVKVAGE